MECTATVLLLPLMYVLSTSLPMAGADTSRCPQTLLHTTKMASYNNRCYQFVNLEKYWDDARDYCWQFGGKLVTIGDVGKNRFIIQTLNGLSWTNKGVWIGLHDRDSELQWEWVTENSHSEIRMGRYTNWGRGHPKAFLHSHRDCVRMKRGSGDWKWHETPCHILKWHYRYICEYEMTPTTTMATTTEEPQPFVLEQIGQQGTNATPESDSHMKDRTSTSATTRTSTSTSTGSTKPSTMPTLPPTTTEFDEMAAFEADDDDDLSGVIVPLRLKQEVENTNRKGVAGGAVACVLFLILVLLILVIVLFRRRQQQKLLEEEADGSYRVENPMYGSPDNNNCTTSTTTTYGSDGKLRMDKRLRAKYGKAENDYGNNLCNNKPNNLCPASTVLAIRGNHYEEADCTTLKADNPGVAGLQAETSSIEDNDHHYEEPRCSTFKPMASTPTGGAAKDNDINVGIESVKVKHALKPLKLSHHQPQEADPSHEEGYEIPIKSPTFYIPMDGNNVNRFPGAEDPESGYLNPALQTSISDEPIHLKCEEYDQPRRENIYAEIPDLVVDDQNIYEDLDEIKVQLGHISESQA